MPPEPHYEPLSPVDIERKLRALISELSNAETALKQARDIEVKAVSEWQAAHRRALLSPEAPRVRREGATAAERDAWVEEGCARQRFDADVATAAREAAQDHLRIVRDQASVVQTLARSVQQAYSMAGVS